VTTCPACPRRQTHGLLCHYCTTRLEHELADVPGILRQLDITLAKQGRTNAPAPGGLAHERTGYHSGASLAADYLTNTLTTWARDLGHWCACTGQHPAATAAHYLAHHIDDVRKHDAAAELHDQAIATIDQARAAADTPANRTIVPVGPCPDCDGTIHAYFPIDDRPPRMECAQNPTAHRWDATQWLRAGRRILDKAASIKATA
jgi:hypothetical protein